MTIASTGLDETIASTGLDNSHHITIILVKMTTLIMGPGRATEVGQCPYRRAAVHVKHLDSDYMEMLQCRIKKKLSISACCTAAGGCLWRAAYRRLQDRHWTRAAHSGLRPQFTFDERVC